MKSMAINTAKSQFGDLVDQIQREPIQIKKYGRPIAVVMSIQEYQHLTSEKLKLEMECLKMRLDTADLNK